MEDIKAMTRELEQIRRERDAAVADIGRVCCVCKYYPSNIGHGGNRCNGYCMQCDIRTDCYCINECILNDKWEWRGLQEVDNR